jgi:hypothetical protein
MTTELTTLKIVVVAPMPSASVRTRIAVNPGCRPIMRSANRRSFQTLPMTRSKSRSRATATSRCDWVSCVEPVPLPGRVIPFPDTR